MLRQFTKAVLNERERLLRALVMAPFFLYRTSQPLDSAKVRFAGGAAALTDALAAHLRAGGVKMVLDCVVNRISTADAEGVLVEGVQVKEHPRGVGSDGVAKLS